MIGPVIVAFRPVFCFTTDRRAVLSLSVLYLAAQLVMFLALDSERRLLASGDNWPAYAFALVKHGAFVEIDDPTQPNLFRPPLIPLFFAAILKLTGDPELTALVPVQVLLIGLAGLFVRDAIEAYLPNRGYLGLGLFWFNPVIFVLPQLAQSEALYLPFIALGTWALMRYARAGFGWPYPLLCALGLALACLTRPSPMFLFFVLPIIFALIAWIAGARDRIRSALVQGAAATVFAAAIVAPWVAVIAAHGHGIMLSDSNSFYRHSWDQAITIYAQVHDITHHEATQALEGPGGVIDRYIAERGPAWQVLSEPQRKRELTRLALRVMASLPPGELLKGLLRSSLYFHFAGGAGEYRNLFGSRAGSVVSIWGTTKQGDALAFVRRYLERFSGWSLAVSVICVGFAVVARLLGLAGVYAMVHRRDWVPLFVSIGLVAYFTLTTLFLGTSRFRVPAEPALTILAVYGLSFLGARFARRRFPARQRARDNDRADRQPVFDGH